MLLGASSFKARIASILSKQVCNSISLPVIQTKAGIQPSARHTVPMSMELEAEAARGDSLRDGAMPCTHTV
jgi:hypothetical protein